MVRINVSMVGRLVALGLVVISCSSQGSSSPPTVSGTPPSQLDASPSAQEFTSLLRIFSSSDPVYPANAAEIFRLFELVALGKISGVAEGRQEYLGEDKETGSRIVARYVNIMVEPSEFLQGSPQSANRPLALEIPWPNNLAIDELIRVAPIGHRVLILASFQDMVYVERTSRPLIEAGLLGSEAIAGNLLVAPDYGIIIEDGPATVSLQDDEVLEFASKAFGINIEGFDDAVKLLRDNTPSK